MEPLSLLRETLVAALVCLVLGYVSVRQHTAKPRAGDVLVEAVRFLVALAIFTGCVFLPALFFDSKSETGRAVAITAALWGPVMVGVGCIVAITFLMLTRTSPRRTIGDIAREKADSDSRRDGRP